jgi:tetratricopeptide (TPR) repeat protein
MWADRGIRLQEALQHLEKAVESDSENGAYLDSLGWCLFKLGDHDRALRELLRASEKIKPEDPVVLEHLGDVFHAQGKRREALASWERALELDSANTQLAEKIRTLRPAAP